MLIRCPECRVCYRIEKEIVPEKGRKFRCARCGRVWRVLPEDLLEETPELENDIYKPDEAENEQKGLEEQALFHTGENETWSESLSEKSEIPEPEIKSDGVGEKTPEDAHASENKPAGAENETAAEEEKEDNEDKSENELSDADRMKEIFSRLDKQNEQLKKEINKISPLKKTWFDIKRALGLDNVFNRMFFLVIMVIIALLAVFSFRYDIVRRFPGAERFYAALGFESVVAGEGLEFQNVSRHEYEEDYIRKLQIKGFLVNTSDKPVKVPEILVRVYNGEAFLLQELTVLPPVDEIRPGNRAAFTAVIPQPSPLSRHILLTFTRDKKQK